MDKRDEITTDIMELWAMVFGNKEYRELGKEKSKWFVKIFDALDNDESNFLEFIIMCETEYEKLIAKEELIPIRSLLLKKYKNKISEKRKEKIIEIFNDNRFDNCCKETFYFIKEKLDYGNN